MKHITNEHGMSYCGEPETIRTPGSFEIESYCTACTDVYHEQFRKLFDERASLTSSRKQLLCPFCLTLFSASTDRGAIDLMTDHILEDHQDRVRKESNGRPD